VPKVLQVSGDALRALQERFQQGDRDAFEALVEPCLDDLYTLCLRLTNNAAEAEDLAQEALVKALRKHHQYRPGNALRPWLLTIGANLARSRLRSVWWRRVLPFAKETETETTPEVLNEAMERDRAVREALATLPPMYREAVAVFHLQDLSYAEMAEITGLKVPALKQRVRRGTKMLREAIGRLYPELVPIRKGTGERLT